ncbi:MAG: hypothetical protein CL679_06920 [Bermanella sp.]|nr:hypothetical protein [Bermanella sp.]
MTWLDKLDWRILLVVAVLLGLAPFQPEPHLYEKLKMLVNGGLTKPVDIFDLLMHGAPLCLVIMKGIRQIKRKQKQ